MPERRGGAHMAAATGRRRNARRGTNPTTVVIAVVAVILLGVGGFFLYRHLTSFGVTVNGTEVTVRNGNTAMQLIEGGYATPKPGNLLAVDGTQIAEGEGEVATVTIDGNPATVDTELKANQVVEITDGGDLTEEADVSEETIPAGKATSSGDSADSYWTGSLHLLSEGKDGTRVTKTGKVSGKTVSEVTVPAVDSGYQIYSARPDDKVIALTFDDGPWETTDDVLDVLEENGAKATFFTIGNQIQNNEAAVKRAANMGCEVLTHSWDHADGSGQGVNLTYMSSSEQVQEIEKGYDAIEEVLGTEPPHIIRAPGGNFYGSIIDTLWDIVDVEVGWDVDTEDWRRPGADSIEQMILSAKPGNVILMHDGGGDRSQTVQALASALPKLKEQGYSFITISELLEYGMPNSSTSSSSSSTSTSDTSSTSDSSSSSTSEGSTSDTDASSGTDASDSTSSTSGTTSSTSTSTSDATKD